MNELHFAFRIRQHLNQGLQHIDDDKLARLRAAREAALAARKAPATIPVLASAGHFVRLNFDSRGIRLALATAVVLLAIATFVGWHGDRLISELSDFDSALLSDDVPMEALVDKDFIEWLRKSGEQ